MESVCYVMVSDFFVLVPRNKVLKYLLFVFLSIKLLN